MNAPAEIAVCLCTYRRPAMLTRLLDALGRLDPVPGSPVEVVIADNDPEGSGIAAVEAFRAAQPDFPHPIRTTHVTTPNISLARNAAAATAVAPWLAWIDDDEVPDPTWLAALVATRTRLDAEVVLGPVLPLLDAAMPGWLIAGERSWGRPRFPTGTEIPANGTRAGNVLIRRTLVTETGFDPAYGVTGGEDSMFFAALADRGVRFWWCDQAVVAEEVPADRRTVDYVIRRGYLGGLSYARVEVGRRDGLARLRTALAIIASAGLRWPVATLMASCATLASRLPGRSGSGAEPDVRVVQWRRTAAAQRGKVAAVVAALRQRAVTTERA